MTVSAIDAGALMVLVALLGRTNVVVTALQNMQL